MLSEVGSFVLIESASRCSTVRSLIDCCATGDREYCTKVASKLAQAGITVTVQPTSVTTSHDIPDEVNPNAIKDEDPCVVFTGRVVSGIASEFVALCRCEMLGWPCLN